MNRTGASRFRHVDPRRPGNLAASALNSSQIKVTWTASPGSTSYTVFREALGDNGFVQVGTGITTQSFTDTALAGGVTYVYQVRATNSVGTSGLSLLTTATTPLGGIPAAPSALVATTVDTSQINHKWTDNSNNESTFSVERSTNCTNFTQIATVGPNITGYTDSGLTASTTYTYRIRAANSAGNSTYASTSAGHFTATPAPITRRLPVQSCGRRHQFEPDQPHLDRQFQRCSGSHHRPRHRQWRFRTGRNRSRGLDLLL